MTVKWKNINWCVLLFGFFVAVYALIMLINSHLGPTNDFMFLRTLQSGQPFFIYSDNFPYFSSLGIGRFAPLGGLEYNIPAFFSKSPSAFWYYFYHAVQFVLLAIIIVKILSRFTSNKFLKYGIPALLFLTPGFALSSFQLQINERNVIFFLGLFILCFFSYLKNQKPIYFILGLVSANLAIYCKETGFIAIGAFAFSYLILSWKTTDKKIKIFNGLLALSSILYLAIYYFHAWLNRGPVLYLSHVANPFSSFAKNFLNYGFFSDPVLILILLPLTAWRIYEIFIRHKEVHPLCDSMLAAGSAYVAGFFALNMYGPYYLLPAYIFALPALVCIFGEEIRKNLFWKTIGGVVVFLLIFNVFPSGIHYLTYNKYLPVNFNKTLDFLIQDINSKHSDKRANIFLDNVDRGNGRGTYFILGEFLQFKGLSEKKFDLKSGVETENPVALVSKISPPFSVFQTDKTDKISSGDYLIISPQSPKNINKDYLQSLNKDYKLIFQTKSPLAFPNFNLKSMLKYFLSGIISQNKNSGMAMANENFLDQPDYYVFVKR